MAQPVTQANSPPLRIITTDNASIQSHTDKSVVAAKFEKIITFYQVFFSSQTKNRLGEIIDVTPGPISDDIKEALFFFPSLCSTLILFFSFSLSFSFSVSFLISISISLCKYAYASARFCCANVESGLILFLSG